MRNHIIPITALLLLFLGSHAPSRAQFTPAPIDGSHATLTTNKKRGETLEIKIKSTSESAWIDLNGDKVCQEKGEKLLQNKVCSVIVAEQSLTIYGDITELVCPDNQLASLDVTKLSNLTWLECQENQLTKLILGNSANLAWLECQENQLSSLILGDMPELTWLECQENLLTHFTIGNAPNLILLEFGQNRLSSVTLGDMPNLGQLNCANNQFSALELSNLTNLNMLYCSDNLLTNLDLSNLPNLQWLECYGNQLSGLDIRQNINIVKLLCYNNRIKEEAMQAIVENLPTPKSKAGEFYPYNPEKEVDDKNVCTPTQVTLAKGKNWKVLTPDGKDFAGIATVEGITSTQLPIRIIVSDGILRITGLTLDMPIEIYSPDGRKVYDGLSQGRAETRSNLLQEEEVQIALPKGIYLLRIGKHTAKAILP